MATRTPATTRTTASARSPIIANYVPRSFYFNGGTFLNFGDNFDLRLADRTYGCWWKSIRNPQPASFNALMGKTNTSSTDGRYFFGLNANGTVFVGYDPGVSMTFSGTVNVCDGRWHSIVVAMDRDANMTLYVDGVSDGSANISASAGNDWDTGISFYLGATGGSSPPIGRMAVPFTVNRLFTAQELADYANVNLLAIPNDVSENFDFSLAPAVGTFTALNGTAGTITGLASYMRDFPQNSVRAPVSPFLHLNPVSTASAEDINLDAAEVPTDLPAPPFTIEVVFRLLALPAANQGLFSHGNINTGAGILLFATSTPGALAAVYRDASVSVSKTLATLRAQINTVHTFTMRVDADSMDIFLDGIYDSQVASPGTGSPYRSGSDMRFMNLAYSTALARGDMMECRYWSVARTNTQIAENSNRFLVDQDSSDLFLYWRFDEGTGTTTTEYKEGLEFDIRNVTSDYWLGARQNI